MSKDAFAVRYWKREQDFQYHVCKHLPGHESGRGFWHAYKVSYEDVNEKAFTLAEYRAVGLRP